MARAPATAPPRVGRSAVVIGASMAGLCAARVLADRFEHVTVLDRDTLPDAPMWRNQVPQGRHPHLLLAAGARLLESWFPGIIDELYAGGAVELDLTADLYWHQGGGPARRPASALKGPSMSRPFLEWTVRSRLEAHPKVTIRGDVAVDGFDLDPTGSRVVAVKLASGDPVACNLVVDASGRQARSLAWLEALGYPQPKVSRVEVDTRYVTEELRRSELPQRDWKMAGVIDEPAAKRLEHGAPNRGRQVARRLRRRPRRGRPHRRPGAPRLCQDASCSSDRGCAPSLRATRRAGHPPLSVQPTTPRGAAEAVPPRLGPARRRRRVLQPHLRPRDDLRRAASRRAWRRARPDRSDRSALCPPLLQGRRPRRERRVVHCRRQRLRVSRHDRPEATRARTSSTATWSGSSSPGGTTTRSRCGSTKSSPWSASPESLMAPRFMLRVLRAARRARSSASASTPQLDVTR